MVHAPETDYIMDMLAATSRTFDIPIRRMPDGLREAVASAYLCMRAVDEVEDHEALSNPTKMEILRRISLAFQSYPMTDEVGISAVLEGALLPYFDALPAVSRDMGMWAAHAPADIAPSIWGATAAMADRMAYWASVNWRIETRADLDAYTYSVAGAIGLLMCDLIAWYDGSKTDRRYGVLFGRGLQLTNIARNRPEDLARGVDFYPTGWTDADVRAYAASCLSATSAYAQALPNAAFSYFVQIPLALAEATLDALARGQKKLSRDAVMQTLAREYPQPSVGVFPAKRPRHELHNQT